MRTLLDSSGWIEFFSDGPLAYRYTPYLKDLSQLVTPTVVLYEVYKKIKRERGEEAALLVAAQLQATEVVPLTNALALAAADISLRYRLAMADAIVYATAQNQGIQLVTSDADLKDLSGVVYIR